MDQLSYGRHRFPPPVIQHAIWLYLRFTLSYRDVEELLAEPGLAVSSETGPRWHLQFVPDGPMAPRRDGAPGCWQADVPVGDRRPRGPGSRHAGSAPARQAGGTPADAQAAQETGLHAEITDDR